MWNTWLLCLTSTLGSCFELSWVRVGRTRTLKESCNDLIFYLPDSAGYSACLAWRKVRTAHGYRSALNYCATPAYVHVGRVCPTSPLHSAPNAMTTSSHILLWYCQQQNEHHRPPAVIFLILLTKGWLMKQTKWLHILQYPGRSPARTRCSISFSY